MSVAVYQQHLAGKLLGLNPSLLLTQAAGNELVIT